MLSNDYVYCSGFPPECLHRGAPMEGWMDGLLLLPPEPQKVHWYLCVCTWWLKHLCYSTMYEQQLIDVYKPFLIVTTLLLKCRAQSLELLRSLRYESKGISCQILLPPWARGGLTANALCSLGCSCPTAELYSLLSPTLIAPPASASSYLVSRRCNVLFSTEVDGSRISCPNLDALI